jgi:hypothetical protein
MQEQDGHQQNGLASELAAAPLQPESTSNGHGSKHTEQPAANVRRLLDVEFERPVADSVSRSMRLTIAAVLTVALFMLWGAMAYLRSEARQLEPPQTTVAVGLVGPTAESQRDVVPSNTVPFALISYAIVLLGIGISWATHDPHAHRLRAIERRSRKHEEQARREQKRAR